MVSVWGSPPLKEKMNRRDAEDTEIFEGREKKAGLGLTVRGKSPCVLSM
jgi:hypothetical protein